MLVVLERIEPQNPYVTMFWFRPPKPVSYTAGQFIEMYLPHKEADGRGQKHWFTLSSSPTEALIAVTTKFALPGSTFKQALQKLKLGDSVQISEPMGDFVLPKDKTIPLVFVAGGIGATPFRSMVKWLVDTKETRDIQVILAANTAQEVVFKDIFEAYALKPILVISSPPKVWTGMAGRLSGERIVALSGGTAGKRIYISGPEPMVEALDKELLALGLAKTQLVGDFFPGYAAV
jgi:ferredoxin-NADP reductase